MAIAWLVLGLALLWIELHHTAFYALFGALASFAAAVTAVVAPHAYVVQALVLVLVTVIGVAALRPLVSGVYERRHPGGLRLKGVHGGLVGQDAVTIDRVASEADVGHALLAGERWLAISGDGRAIPAGRHVTVTAVVGTTLVVWPVDGLFPTSDSSPGLTP
jgi:membrane protein implicated in regulation of membrane protease activity